MIRLTKLAIVIAACSISLLSAKTPLTKLDTLCYSKKLDCAELKAAVQSIRNSGSLPEKFITKKEAKQLGWQPGHDLARRAPGKSIGGDRFGNFEKQLPAKNGRQWFEADLSFKGGKRGAKRLLYSSDRLIFVTTDHYKTFEEIAE